jgi:tetratricopeptide (TPR) repeat protein
VLTWRQIDTWKDSLTLWEHTLAVTKDNPLARTLYGAALLERGRDLDGERELQEALRIRPDMDPALDQLGALREKQGRRQEALGYYQRAAAIRPDSKRYRGMLERLETENGSRPDNTSPKH